MDEKFVEYFAVMIQDHL